MIKSNKTIFLLLLLLLGQQVLTQVEWQSTPQDCASDGSMTCGSCKQTLKGSDKSVSPTRTVWKCLDCSFYAPDKDRAFSKDDFGGQVPFELGSKACLFWSWAFWGKNWWLLLLIILLIAGGVALWWFKFRGKGSGGDNY